MTTSSSATRALVFDIDGTLVDTAYVHTVTWWQAFRSAGLDVEMALIHRSVGMGGGALLDNVLPDRDRSVDDTVKQRRLEHYKRFWDDLRPLPGARELIRTGKERGLSVVLASSAEPEELDVLRRTLDADQWIDVATGAGDAEHAKPAPDILEVALDRAGVDAESAVFVGDAVWDADVAAQVGVPFVGVECGGTSAAELREHRAAAVYRNPAELLSCLDDAPLRQLLRG